MDLNQVTVPALDVEQSIRFYSELGLRLIVRSQHYARFECTSGNSTFSIHHTDKPLEHSGIIVYFECEDLDGRVHQLIQQGFLFDQLPRDEVWLWREARLRDPSGNIICLYFAGHNRRNPPWRIE